MGEATGLDVVRGMLEAAAREDWDAVLAAYDPQIEWDLSHTRLPEASVYRGRGAIVEYMRRWLTAWGEWQAEAESLTPAGDRVVAVMIDRVRGEHSGVDAELRHAIVHTVAEGRIKRMEFFDTAAEAFAAVGLEQR